MQLGRGAGGRVCRNEQVVGSIPAGGSIGPVVRLYQFCVLAALIFVERFWNELIFMPTDIRRSCSYGELQKPAVSLPRFALYGPVSSFSRSWLCAFDTAGTDGDQVDVTMAIAGSESAQSLARARFAAAFTGVAVAGELPTLVVNEWRQPAEVCQCLHFADAYLARQLCVNNSSCLLR